MDEVPFLQASEYQLGIPTGHLQVDGMGFGESRLYATTHLFVFRHERSVWGLRHIERRNEWHIRPYKEDYGWTPSIAFVRFTEAGSGPNDTHKLSGDGDSEGLGRRGAPHHHGGGASEPYQAKGASHQEYHQEVTLTGVIFFTSSNVSFCSFQRMSSHVKQSYLTGPYHINSASLLIPCFMCNNFYHACHGSKLKIVSTHGIPMPRTSTPFSFDSHFIFVFWRP